MVGDYKSGKIDIFGPMDKKKFDKQFQEEYGIDLPQKVAAKQSESSKSGTRK